MFPPHKLTFVNPDFFMIGKKKFVFTWRFLRPLQKIYILLSLGLFFYGPMKIPISTLQSSSKNSTVGGLDSGRSKDLAMVDGTSCIV